MTPLPKRRHSSQRQAKRSRALPLSKVTLVTCKQCQALYQPHHVCASCGYYNGIQVVFNKQGKTKTA